MVMLVALGRGYEAAAKIGVHERRKYIQDSQACQQDQTISFVFTKKYIQLWFDAQVSISDFCCLGLFRDREALTGCE